MVWLYQRRQLVLYVVVAAAFAVGGYLLYQHFHPPNPVTQMSQEQAETPQGVREAAEQAQVHISHAQAEEIADEICEAPKRQPDRVVETTGAKLANTAEQERVKAGADLAIVADSAQPDKKTDLATIPADKPVVLNQYNVQAYPRALLEFTAYNDKTMDVAYLQQVRLFGMTGYVGPAVTIGPDTTRVGVRLSIPL